MSVFLWGLAGLGFYVGVGLVMHALIWVGYRLRGRRIRFMADHPEPRTLWERLGRD